MLDREFHAGHVLTAKDLNEIKAEVRRLGRVSAAAPMNVSSDASGLRFDVAAISTFPVKLSDSGGDGSYAWTGQDPVSGGTWQDNADSGTRGDDPAWEANLNDAIPDDTIVLRAYRDPETGEVRFEHGTCS